MVHEVKTSLKLNVENLFVKNNVKNDENVGMKNGMPAQGSKTVKVKRKTWTRRKNGLFGWSSTV